jgi:hypothetical protein
MAKKKQTPKSKQSTPVIVRANEAGCHYGYIESKRSTEIVLRDARRLWYWIGASLSQVAAEGAEKVEGSQAVAMAPLREAGRARASGAGLLLLLLAASFCC